MRLPIYRKILFSPSITSQSLKDAEALGLVKIIFGMPIKISHFLPAGLLFSISAGADLQATTKGGREVLLRDKGL
jgi:hypothetical protein